MNSQIKIHYIHSYLPLYEKLLYPIRDTAKNILEVGIGNFIYKNGGSVLLWSQYFSNAKIYGIDVLPKDRVIKKIKKDMMILFLQLIELTDKDIFFLTNKKNE
jgi:hypothetical protein